MSNDPVRLTFSDGTELFTMGNGGDVTSLRLWNTEEEAVTAYSTMKDAVRERGVKDPIVLQYYAYVTEEERKLACTDAEVVEIEIHRNGAEWKEMFKPFCKASKTHKLIVYGPSYSEGDYT